MTALGLIVGHPRDSAIMHVRGMALTMGASVSFVDVGEFLASGSIESATSPDAVLRVAGSRYCLDDFTCIYQRAYLGPAATPEAQSRLVALLTALGVSRARVINRPYSGWQNMSKPLQMLMLQEYGFLVPVSRSTSIPDDFRRFRNDHADIVYKSNSGERSIVERISDQHDDRSGYLVSCPVLFQERIVGDDVRVHVVDDETFAVRIQSDAVDYRYYRARGSFAKLEPEAALPPAIRERCIAFAAASGAVLAGFDFKVDSQGRWYCLEMNPAPAFESYDHVLGGVIAGQIVKSLAGVTRPLLG